MITSTELSRIVNSSYNIKFDHIVQLELFGDLNYDQHDFQRPIVVFDQ